MSSVSQGFFLGVHVGTGSARAGVFDASGVLLGQMTRMSAVTSVIAPNPAARAFHDKKQRVFLRMHDDQLAYRREMA